MNARPIGVSLLLALAMQVPAQSIVVSQNRGDDAAAGTREAPVRTITRGVALARASGGKLVRLEYGEYGAGESLPIELPPGIELAGIGAAGSSLAAGGKVAFRLLPPAPGSTTVLGGLGITAASTGLEITAAAAPADLVLRGVAFTGCRTGLHVTTGQVPIRITGTGVRSDGCKAGVDVDGLGPCTLHLADSLFAGGDVGVLLRNPEAADDRGSTAAVQHDLELVRCAFVGCTRAGVERRGAAGPNGGPAYAFTGCTFTGCGTGIELLRPAADTPLTVTDCRFHANPGCGVRLCGAAGDASLRSVFAQCEFRWNGIGLHATNSRVVCAIARCRFVDNLGAALFLANFMTAPLSADVADSLIAGNGGNGVYAMADGERLAVSIAHCTIADNGSAGIERKTRHSGSSTLAIRHCIVSGNARNLEKIAADEVTASLVGDGSAGSGRGNLAGDPGFALAGAGDWSLRPDSQCIDRGELHSGAPAIDLAGRPRDGRPDLGAFELTPPPSPRGR